VRPGGPASWSSVTAVAATDTVVRQSDDQPSFNGEAHSLEIQNGMQMAMHLKEKLASWMNCCIVMAKMISGGR
jgi:hypothetical protein